MVTFDYRILNFLSHISANRILYIILDLYTSQLHRLYIYFTLSCVNKILFCTINKLRAYLTRCLLVFLVTRNDAISKGGLRRFVILLVSSYRRRPLTSKPALPAITNYKIVIYRPDSAHFLLCTAADVSALLRTSLSIALLVREYELVGGTNTLHRHIIVSASMLCNFRNMQQIFLLDKIDKENVLRYVMSKSS